MIYVYSLYIKIYICVCLCLCMYICMHVYIFIVYSLNLMLPHLPPYAYPNTVDDERTLTLALLCFFVCLFLIDHCGTWKLSTILFLAHMRS